MNESIEEIQEIINSEETFILRKRIPLFIVVGILLTIFLAMIFFWNFIQKSKSIENVSYIKLLVSVLVGVITIYIPKKIYQFFNLKYKNQCIRKMLGLIKEKSIYREKDFVKNIGFSGFQYTRKQGNDYISYEDSIKKTEFSDLHVYEIRNAKYSPTIFKGIILVNNFNEKINLEKKIVLSSEGEKGVGIFEHIFLYVVVTGSYIIFGELLGLFFGLEKEMVAIYSFLFATIHFFIYFMGKFVIGENSNENEYERINRFWWLISGKKSTFIEQVFSKEVSEYISKLKEKLKGIYNIEILSNEMIFIISTNKDNFEYNLLKNFDISCENDYYLLKELIGVNDKICKNIYVYSNKEEKTKD